MEPGSPQAPAPQPDGLPRKAKLLYWIAAAALAIATMLELREKPDYLRASGRVALLVALVLLATSRPAESRTKKVIIYLLLAVGIGLFIAHLVAR